MIGMTAFYHMGAGHQFDYSTFIANRRRALRSLDCLPTDLLLDIASFLEFRSDILHLTSASTKLYNKAIAALYDKVTLDTPAQCVQTLNMLSSKPSIARHVRTLVLHPDKERIGRSTPFEYSYGYNVSSIVRRVAGEGRLDALNTFEWDGGEMPGYDDMWIALRMSCPQLKTIRTSAGTFMPSRSGLFEFKNLKGFSINIKPDLNNHFSDVFLPPSSKLWDMLLDRCPNLEELCIDGFSVHPTDMGRLIQGRWPKLRTLVLGDVLVDMNGSQTPGTKRPFIEFLEMHPNLEVLTASRHALSPAHLTTMEPTALPMLHSFTGTLEQLQFIAPHHLTLTHVGFSEPMLMRDVTPLAVSLVLQGLVCLESLSIGFVLGSMYESGNLVRSLVGACPKLRKLELVCGHKPSFPLDSFSKAIQQLPKLQSLSLTLVKFPGDDSLSCSAALIARSNPRLHQFNITFIPSSVSLPLPQPLFSHPAYYNEMGSYTVTADQHGLPLCLYAVERRAGSQGVLPGLGRLWVYLGGSPSVHRYRVDLRPGLGKAGLKAWADLLTERSTAGEELRMLMFLTLLFVLAVWGFLVVGIEEREE